MNKQTQFVFLEWKNVTNYRFQRRQRFFFLKEKSNYQPINFVQCSVKETHALLSKTWSVKKEKNNSIAAKKSEIYESNFLQRRKQAILLTSGMYVLWIVGVCPYPCRKDRLSRCRWVPGLLCMSATSQLRAHVSSLRTLAGGRATTLNFSRQKEKELRSVSHGQSNARGWKRYTSLLLIA